MNKVITINLGGAAYQLEEGGYDALRRYLDAGMARLHGNPDRDEIISDIERAIGEKFRALLNSFKNVILATEVEAVLAEMGPIEADPAETAGAEGSAAEKGAARPERAADSPGTPKRLYRLKEGAMLAGVCNGLAAYLNIDPTIIRLAFVFLSLLCGAGVLVYLVAAIVVPEARSAEEKAALRGEPSTAQAFIRRAKEGYYEAMKGFPDRKTRREWRHKFRREMRSWRKSFKREMYANAWDWQRHWHRYGAASSPGRAGAAVALPILSLLLGAAAILWICALISVLATGTFFGLALPAHVPVWLAALALFIAYGIFVAPLKAARRACLWGFWGPAWLWPFAFLVEAVVWSVVVVALLWLAIRHFPELRDAIRHLPAHIREAADSIKAWWSSR